MEGKELGAMVGSTGFLEARIGPVLPSYLIGREELFTSVRYLKIHT